MAKKINLGKVGITTAGAYDPQKAYERLSCVTYNYESWVSTKDVPAGNTPQDGSEYWQKMAARGERGPQGQSYVDKELVPIVNDLTTGGSANVLSAEQGKVLKTEVTELSAKTDVLDVTINGGATDVYLLNEQYVAPAHNMAKIFDVVISNQFTHTISVERTESSTGNSATAYIYFVRADNSTAYVGEMGANVLTFTRTAKWNDNFVGIKITDVWSKDVTYTIAITKNGEEVEGLKGKVEAVEGLSNVGIKGKKIMFFGDSITRMTNDEGKTYSDYIAANYKADVYNAGVSGSNVNMERECITLEFSASPSSAGDVVIKGILYTWTLPVQVGESLESMAANLASLCKSHSPSVSALANGAKVIIENWSGFTNPINPSSVTISTDTGVGLEVVEYANNMYPFFRNNDNALNNLSILNLVEGWVSGDTTLQRVAATYIGTDRYTQAVDVIESVSIADVDIVVLAGGTNNYASVWGNASDTNNSLGGAFNRVIKRLLTEKPELKIVILTPIPRYFGNDISNWDDSKWGDNYVANGHNGVMKELASFIKGVAEYHHMPCFNLYSEIGWNPYNFHKFFKNTDGTHPSYGLKWMGEKIGLYLVTNI